ncbi:hypothetical protein [Streptomyces albogriseolus]
MVRSADAVAVAEADAAVRLPTFWSDQLDVRPLRSACPRSA